MAGCSSSARTPISPTRVRSKPGSSRSTTPSGTSMPSDHSPDPKQVLAYLARYTHRVAISNSRLISADETGVTFRYKDYRIEGPGRYKTMTLAPAEFIRRFMLHVLPKGFHRIRHYGLLGQQRRQGRDHRASTRVDRRGGAGAATSARRSWSRRSLATEATDKPIHPCPCCGGRMIIIETFEAGSTPRHRPTASAITIRVDTS